MIGIVIVLSILLAGAAAFIFWLLQVLKNTLDMTDELVDMINDKVPKKNANSI